ncbi:carotenoid biosynthesis protein [Adhaeribacter swui]|uniref:Carotenoid biosynthesis protein n=1 Tax=Adhaeribacter swui TaxID=2086471 RepID=A0A7G7GF41_9BACT|nr:carotenoid biosynthesis protein [Adhaeribacter swui]
MYSAYQSYFLKLVPFNLLLTNSILFFFHRDYSRPFGLFALVVFLVGFFAEVIGIHTALLFGHYSYGASLGWQLFRVPVIIGLNWLMLVYTSGHLVNYLPQLPWWLRSILAAFLMVALDYFIEPVAVALDFWSWQSGEIPVSNFTGWFGVALLLQGYFQKSDFLKNNTLAPFVFLLQFLFFTALYAVI